MTPKTKRRGYDPSDEACFSEAATKQLRQALNEMIWLLDRNYKLKQVVDLVGGHYQLTARQRTALQRAAVVTGDSVILDDCESWLNMGRWIVEQCLPEAWIVELESRD